MTTEVAMQWRNLTMAMMVAGVAAGCQTARTSDSAEREELEARIAELEEKLATQPEESEAGEAPAPVATRSAAAERSTARPAPATAPARVADPKPDPEPKRAAPAPRPAPTPRPTPPPIVVARGTQLRLVLETPLSSGSSQVGDRVVAKVAEAIGPDGDVALPGGAYVEGRVTEVAQAGRVKGRARLAASFDRLVVRGSGHSIETTGLYIEAEKGTKKDAAIIGGGAAAGAILGGIVGGKKGAGKGVLVGGAAGTGAVLATKGEEVDLPAGSGWTVEVLSALRF
jgi:hypothetical protein